jgi:outer membrane protein OmpA-like peptidoglycan-associated protein
MKKFITLILLIVTFSYTILTAQFHDYNVKYGFQGHLLVPSTEFDSELYRLSLLGRGFVKFELNSYLETEFGIAIGELNGIDYTFSNWSTSLIPADVRLIFSPSKSPDVSPYFYSGLTLLHWKIDDLPKAVSPKKTKDTGWNLAIPVGFGIEINLGNEVLLDISGHYTYAKTDDLNYFNNPVANDGYFDFGVGLTFVMGSTDADEDGDGLSSSMEKEIGTDPNEFDTDLDKLSDGDEINIYRTNPLNPDSDNDGIEDYDEIKIYNTDPKSFDTDGDGLSDADEISRYGSNANNKDSDGDNLNDGSEINTYNTDPIMFDTDMDELSDGEEIKTYNTDPLNPDTDGDGINDGDEILIHKTNPLKNDNNNLDTENITNNQDTPSDPVSIELIEENSDLLDIRFDSGKTEIKKESEPILYKTLQELNDNPNLKIELRGYTDNVGNVNSNKKLSQERADAVRIWLVKKGIDALRIKSIGYGSENPIAENSTEEGRNKNRRIELIKK